MRQKVKHPEWIEEFVQKKMEHSFVPSFQMRTRIYRGREKQKGKENEREKETERKRAEGLVPSALPRG
jgi:hypothetical protein